MSDQQVRPKGSVDSEQSPTSGTRPIADAGSEATSPAQSPTQAAHAAASSSSIAPVPSSSKHAPDTLLLPKFKKNQRQIDFHTHEGCCDKNVPNRPASLEAGVLSKQVEYQGFACVNMGTRDHMEDRHKIVYGKQDGLFRTFFGVFDGHGGEEASHFTHQHLHEYVLEELEAQYRIKAGLAPVPSSSSSSSAKKARPSGEQEEKEGAIQREYVGGLTESQIQSYGLDYKSILVKAFDRLEEQVLRQSRKVGCRDGTTVTSVLITHDTIYCANTGDSRTVLCRDGSAVALSSDHKPSNDDERARIVSAGGEVRAVMLERAAFCCFKAKKVPHGAERLWPGGFSVSRAVGDIDYKLLARKKASVVNVLIHKPDVTTTSINPRDQFIICGSDGLWDVLTNQQAVDFVLKEIKKKKSTESVADISQKLTDHAYSLGSEDNITALVMFFSNHDIPFKH